MNFWDEMEAAYHDMVALKVSLGYNKETYRPSQVLPFLNYCVCKFPDAHEITQEMLDSWLLVREFATDNTRKHIIINIRHFTRYLNAIGQKAFVPTEEYNIKVKRYQPHIFTDGELRQLFDPLNSVKPCVRSHAEWILPVLFRLELCCGMRPNEPLNLRVEDVDLRTGDIFIRKSKRGKDRHVVISENTRIICVNYDRFAGNREWFFQHWNGGKFSTTWARNRFRGAWIRSGLSKSKSFPRPYDLCHSYAVAALQSGDDIKTVQETLGHHTAAFTLDVYGHVTDQMKRASAERMEQFIRGVSGL